MPLKLTIPFPRRAFGGHVADNLDGPDPIDGAWRERRDSIRESRRGRAAGMPAPSSRARAGAVRDVVRLSRGRTACAPRTQVCWKAMIRQVLVAVLACAVGAAPLATELCEAACAGHSAAHGTSSVHHHHSGDAHPSTTHHHPASAESHRPLVPIALASAVHPCAHVEAVVTESPAPLPAPGPHGVIANVERAAARMQPRRAIVIDGRHGPPASIAFIAPLRI
jgi:hypothetical protein